MNFRPSLPLPGRLGFSPRVAIIPSAPATRVLTAILLAGFAATGATAQQVTSSGGAAIIQQYGGPPAPAQPPPPETAHSGPSLGPGGRPTSKDWVDYDRVSANDHRASRQPFGPFYLPTLLPVLGSAQAANPEHLAPGYPRESAGEPFFMAHGNLAANQLLSDPRADLLASYRTARLTLLTELRAELDHAQTVPAATRKRALAELAAVQTPRLLELEAEAEQIRHELTFAELFKVTADDIGQVVPVGEKPGLKADLAAIRLILSAAHFRAGFSPDQRRLLEEMAQEIRLTLEPDRSGRAVFFWPAGARIPPPQGLAPEATAQFEEFQRRKTALKAGLRAALERENKQVFNVKHTEHFEQLAAAQAPRFAELDALADEIRPALAALAAAGDTLVTGLPADLTQQLTSLAERKAALQHDLRDKLAEFSAQLPADRVELTPHAGGLAITVAPNGDLPSDREAVLARIKAFNEEVSGRFAALVTVRDRVRDGLARYQAANPGAKPGQTVDQLAAEFLAAHHAREYRNRQRDYAAAVLASGLSPAQRRLLLAAAAANSLQASPSSDTLSLAASRR